MDAALGTPLVSLLVRHQVSTNRRMQTDFPAYTPARGKVGNPEDPTIYQLGQLSALSVQAAEIETTTQKYPVLSQLLALTRKG